MPVLVPSGVLVLTPSGKCLRRAGGRDDDWAATTRPGSPDTSHRAPPPAPKPGRCVLVLTPSGIRGYVCVGWAAGAGHAERA